MGIYQQLFNPYFLVGLVVVMSVLLVAELPLFSLKFKQFGWKGNEIRYVFILLTVVLIPLLGVWSIPIIVFLYLNFSLINNKTSKKKHHEV
jgi:CDP-diacylglycerol--serine O-phosphatidyltransferase